MATQFLAIAAPATAAAVGIALALMVVIMTALVAFCVRMMSGPVALFVSAPPTSAPSTSSRTVEEWTYFPNGNVRRIVRSEATR